MKKLIQEPVKLFVIIFCSLVVSCHNVHYPEPDKDEIILRHERHIQHYKEHLPAILSLKEAQKIALINNPDPQIAKKRIEQAMAKFSQASAALYPKLDFNFDITHIQDSSSRGLPFVSPENYELYSPALQFSWLIYDGLNRKYQILAADYRLASAKQHQINSERILLNLISQNFYTAALQLELIKIAEEDASFNDKQAKDVQKKMDEGMSGREELLNFKLRFNDAQVELLNAQQQYKIQLIVLAELMGLSDASALKKTKLDIAIDQTLLKRGFNFDKSLEQANERADLKALFLEIQAAHAQLKAGNSLYRPKLSSSIQYGYSRLDDLNFHKNDREFQGGLNLNIPIYNKSRKYQIEELKSIIAELELQYVKERNAISSQLKQKITSLEIIRKKLESLTVSLALSSEIRDIELKKYQVGKASITRLNEVQTALVKAQSRLRLEQVRVLLIIEDILSETGENWHKIHHEMKKK